MPEDDFSDSWRAYRGRAEPWLPLGRCDDQEHDQPPDRSWRWLGEERDREDR